MKAFPQLPVYHKLDEISKAFSSTGCAVVSAEPGAGKTMLVPVLAKEYGKGKLTILVEPRRIAARAAAYGIAAMHGFTVGKETGFAVRGEKCDCQKDGILAATPGVLLQMLQSDPFLEDVSAIIFDEFHERSLESDLALALVLDVRSSLRDDLLLAVMSATMDSDKVSSMLNTPLITVPGRNFPVDIRYRETPNDLRELPRHTARAIMENLENSTGNILVFLPGAEEIRQTAMLLENLPQDRFAVYPLHGSLPLAGQKDAIAPEKNGRRKIILATNVAESSLTIDQVCCVIDTGWEKKSIWHPGAQMNFLETRRITKASAAQRAGRAGRTAPGIAVRCYDRFTFEQFPDHITPEILNAELSSLLLAVSSWGSRVDDLNWVDSPELPAVAAAGEVLYKLGFFTEKKELTPAGKKAAKLPVSPRIAAMMIFTPPSQRRCAAEFAAILEERDDFPGFDTADLRERVSRMRANPRKFALQQTILSRLLKEFPPLPEKEDDDPGLPIATAFPEWIGKKRTANGTIFQLANGGAAKLKDNDFLRKEEFLAIARIDGGNSANSAIRLALPIERSTIVNAFSRRITEKNITVFDSANEKISAFAETKLDELILTRRPIQIPPGSAATALIRECSRRSISLPPTENKRAFALVERLRFAKSCGMDELPDLEDPYDFFLRNAHFFPDDISSLNDLRKADYWNILHAAIDYSLLMEVDRLCPEYFTAPSGHRFPIDYSGKIPVLAIIIKELYGVNTHPTVGKNKMPLKLELLSPAGRPVQITGDLPGFWKGSWSLVRSEMKSRYPKHNWPEHPENYSAKA